MVHVITSAPASVAVEREPDLSQLTAALSESRQREQELDEQCASLEEAIRSLAAAREPETVFQRLTESARTLAQARYAALAIFGPDGAVARFCTAGLPDGTALAGERPCGRGLLGALARSREPIRLEDLTRDPRSAGFPAKHVPMRSFLGVPVLLREQNVGNLYLTEKLGAPAFTEDDERLLVRLSRYAAVAIENARLYAETLAAERLKREFLSLVTHELRTPLTGIKGIVSGLLAEDVALDPAERRELLVLVEQAADHLSTLVNNLLDMSRLEAGALDLEPEACAAADLIASAVRDNASVLRAHHVEVEVLPCAPECADDCTAGEQPEVWADYAQARRVLANLLGNAAKYAPTGSTVRVTAGRCGGAPLTDPGDSGEGAKRAGVGEAQGQVLFTVQDEGPGIAADDLPHVFERFYRGGDRPARGQAGTGLGLAIARGLVEAMGGRIWAASVPGQGAAFTFTLPAARTMPPGKGWRA